MRIIYDHQAFNEQRYGGISRYFFELISQLVNNYELDISVYMGLHINEYELEKLRLSFLSFLGSKRPMIPKTGRVFAMINQLGFLYFGNTNYANIYHQTYYRSFPYKNYGKKIITVHDMIHELFPQYFRENDPTVMQKKESIKKADGIICVSESTKRDLLELYDVPPQNVKVIYHGNSLRSPVNGPPIVDRPYILYVGDRWGYKNFGTLLSAINSLSIVKNNYCLVCFGGGYFTKEEKERINHLHLNDKVLHYGGNDTVLSNLYKYASAFVYPSLYEGFGIPPLEAMYYGCPIVVSNRSSIPEVAGDAGLYFPPEDVEALASQLYSILCDNELRSLLITRGREQERNFSWMKCARETLNFYQSIVNS